MPPPITACRASTSTDEILHDMLRFRPEASALRTPDAAPDSAHEAPTSAAHGDDPLHELHTGAVALEAASTGVEVAEPILEHGHVLLAGELGPQAIASGVASQLLAVWGTLREGEERGIAFDSAQMQGALARLEGRHRDPDVLARAARDPGFASGLRRADHLAWTEGEAFACAERQVRAIGLEGERAVLTGTDRGPAFERRYEHDLAFRHGVERARERRELTPAEHEAQQREVRELQERMEQARGSSAIRG